MKQIRILLRLEGGMVLAASVLTYSFLDFSTLWFLVLLLVPDISMLGYLANKELGRKTYNLGHSYLLPAILVGVGIANHSDIAVQASLIWIAHIGFDRFMGYGLKTGSFQETHLGKIGKRQPKK